MKVIYKRAIYVFCFLLVSGITMFLYCENELKQSEELIGFDDIMVKPENIRISDVGDSINPYINIGICGAPFLRHVREADGKLYRETRNKCGLIKRELVSEETQNPYSTIPSQNQ